MRIDCRDLACPEPVINTKKALDALPADAVLEVMVNTKASLENIERFVKNSGYTMSFKNEGGDTKITIVKGYECPVVGEGEEKSEFLDKVLFLKDDKAGEGELGGMLVVGFLKSILELPKLPKAIICVNRAVFLTTSDEDSDVVKILKEFEKRGVEIFSCGVCLDFYKVSEKLKVGVVGNAYGTVDMLLNSNGTITL